MNRESTDTRLTLGYARVSTLEQDESLQRDALEAAGVTGCSSTKRRASSARGRRWTRSSSRSARATPSSCGASIGWAGPCGT